MKLDLDPAGEQSVSADLPNVPAILDDKTQFLDESEVEKLTSENARLEDGAARTLPESPWYRSILMTVVVGVSAGAIFLIK